MLPIERHEPSKRVQGASPAAPKWSQSACDCYFVPKFSKTARVVAFSVAGFGVGARGCELAEGQLHIALHPTSFHCQIFAPVALVVWACVGRTCGDVLGLAPSSTLLRVDPRTDDAFCMLAGELSASKFGVGLSTLKIAAMKL